VRELLQTEPAAARPATGLLTAVSQWQIAILTLLSLWLYGPTLAHLVAQWWHDPNFSHGFFVPLFSALVLWQERRRLAQLPLQPSWAGLGIMILALLIFVVGQMGAELFLARFSMLILLVGLIVLFMGWNFLRALSFPLAFLVLMIPIPTIVFNQITFPLQLLASRLAAGVLPVLGVPVLREGNVIYLPNMPLEVADACSGIRSLMSLGTLAVIYGYLMDRRIILRVVLAVASVPIAVVANSLRIVGTGLIVQYWDSEKAEGFFHAGWGWIIFVICLVSLFLLHRLLLLVWPENDISAVRPAAAVTLSGKRPGQVLGKTWQFGFAVVLIAVTGLLLQTRGRFEVFPPRQPLESFPEQLDSWTSTDIPIGRDVLDILGPGGDFLFRQYRAQGNVSLPIEVFIGYFPSQRAGETPHSPQHCLPGSGWLPVENSRVTLLLPGHAPFPANRYVVSKGDSRQLVLYWFWAHDRGVASEYWAKFYLVKDALQMNRSDGALVRIATPMFRGETSEAAQQRLMPFTSDLFPLLNNYIPR